MNNGAGNVDPTSPYYVPPRSIRALRLSLVVLLIAPTLLIIAAGVAVALHLYWGLLLVVVLGAWFARPRYRLFKAVRGELDRRKGEQFG